jgi:hypothetical protein
MTVRVGLQSAESSFMHQRFVSHSAVALATVIALAAFACSSATEPGPIGRDTKKTEPKPTAPEGENTPAASTPTTATPGTTTPAPAGVCGKKADANACFECCIEKDPAAFEAADKVWFDCACAADACKTACADSVCGTTDAEPNAACTTCLQQKGPACETQADAACQANAGCKAIDACAQTECAPLDKSDGGAP